jgi:hypothetical protein
MSDNGKVWENGYKTGHCLAGNHFGTRNLSPGGALLPACNSGPICRCRCHPEILDEEMRAFIASTLGPNAILPPDPTLEPTTVNIIQPKASVVARVVPGVDDPRLPGMPPDHPDDLPAMLDSGRRARGSLDYEVKTVCDRYLRTYGTGTNGLTPQTCARMIDAGTDRETSPGAVDAVWRRWVTLGFAVMGSKPVHFAGYTPEGVEKGLHKMQYEAKRRKRGLHR